MDNQHKLIKGYRDLSQEEITAMNEIKELERQVGLLFQKVSAMPDVDQRWAGIARTDLQKGFMGLVRSIAKPQSEL